MVETKTVQVPLTEGEISFILTEIRVIIIQHQDESVSPFYYELRDKLIEYHDSLYD